MNAVPPAVVECLRYVLQETSANSVHHGRAKQITISGAVGEEAIDLTIQDDGCGFDPDAISRRGGLRSIRERIDRLSGDVEISSDPYQGTSFEIHIPFDMGAHIPV